MHQMYIYHHSSNVRHHHICFKKFQCFGSRCSNVGSVTIFGEISPLWQNFTSLWLILEGLLNICQHFEPIWAHFDEIGQILIVANGQIWKTQSSHLVTLSFILSKKETAKKERKKPLQAGKSTRASLACIIETQEPSLSPPSLSLSSKSHGTVRSFFQDLSFIFRLFYSALKFLWWRASTSKRPNTFTKLPFLSFSSSSEIKWQLQFRHKAALHFTPLSLSLRTSLNIHVC